VPRAPGGIHCSTDVVYRESSGVVHDYAGEYRALRELQTRGVIDVELHGYTHMSPDLDGWAKAADRYDAVGWYRELGRSALPYLSKLRIEDHPLAIGLRTLDRCFGVRPSTLICPGDEWTNDALEVALSLGVQAVSSYYFALRYRDRFCWNQYICAPYLNEPDAAWFDSGQPIVGYFHDAEPSLYGSGWLAKWLDAWSSAGARRFVTLRELALAHSLRLRVTHGTKGCVMDVRGDNSPMPGISIPVKIRVPGATVPSQVLLSVGDRSSPRPIDVRHDGQFYVPLAAPVRWELDAK
jgi:hypothetical protein